MSPIGLLALLSAACAPEPADRLDLPDPTDRPRPFEDTFYDPVLDVTWLVNANLAEGSALAGVLPDGTMDYETALAWVDHLNAGDGYLRRTDWQLPTTPPHDPTCAVPRGHDLNAFGPGCTQGALAHAYGVLLHRSYPSLAASVATNTIGPLKNLQQGLYWTSGVDGDMPPSDDEPHAYTFSFTSGEQSRNTTSYNYFYVLPVMDDAIGGAAPKGQGIVPYTEGPAAGLAVYDTLHDKSWPVDATLAATESFDVCGGDTVHASDVSRRFEVPLVTTAGTMRFGTAGDWIAGMKAAGYAGSSEWRLPSVTELERLHHRLGLDDDPTPLLRHGVTGDFRNLQLYFYWSCQRDEADPTACSSDGPGQNEQGIDMQWDFNFEDGFQGTAEHTKHFFVAVYHPGR